MNNAKTGTSAGFLVDPAARQEAAAEIRAAIGPDKHFSMAVFPQVGVPAEISGAYDYAALSAFCNYIVIMGYDNHYAGEPPLTLLPD